AVSALVVHFLDSSSRLSPLSEEVAMSEHIVVLSDLTNSPRETAELLVSCGSETRVICEVVAPPASARFTFDVGLSGYCSSNGSTVPNLFTATGGKAGLLRLTTSSPGDVTSVILSHRSGSSELLLHVP